MRPGKITLVPKRGEIYLVNFDPTQGSEIRKTRPAIVIQNDVANASSPVTIVAAISSKADSTLYPTEVPLPADEGGVHTDAVILCNQIRTIDKRRVVKRIGRVKSDRLRDVDTALRISLGLTSLQ